MIPYRDVLLCELRGSHWVIKPRDEGTQLILWRGPNFLIPDSDCDWREPYRTELFPGGRRIVFREHCRRRPTPGPADRIAIIEVAGDYSTIRLR